MLTISSSRPSLHTDFMPAEVLQQQQQDADDEVVVGEQSGSVAAAAVRQRSENNGEVVLFHLQEDSDGFYHDEPTKTHT